MKKKDIIVVGASAGGIEALSQLVSKLPPEFPGTIFVVVHVPKDATSVLPSILSRRSRLPAVHPSDGDRPAPGHIYVAPPNYHMLVERDRVRLVRGPREHGTRPAVDPLFRSAALGFGPRVVGIVLSGNLDDGTSGLEVIKASGGTGLVQDPGEAMYSGMISSAIQSGCVDEVLPAARIAARLVELAGEQAATEATQMAEDNDNIKEAADEVAIDELAWTQLHGDDQSGIVSWLIRRLLRRARQSGQDANIRRYNEEAQPVAQRARMLRDTILSGILSNGRDETRS